jgi:hypothetical protein
MRYLDLVSAINDFDLTGRISKLLYGVSCLLSGEGGSMLSFHRKKKITSKVRSILGQRQERIATRTVPDMIFPNKQKCYIILYTTPR